MELPTKRSLLNEITKRTPLHNSLLNILGTKISQEKTVSPFHNLQMVKPDSLCFSSGSKE